MHKHHDSFIHAVDIPFWWSLITGAMVFAVAFILLLWSDYFGIIHLAKWYEIIIYASIPACVALLVSWFARSEWGHQIVWDMMHPDAPQTAEEEYPPAEEPITPITITLQDKQDPGLWDVACLNLPAPKDKVLRLASGIVNNEPLTVSYWCGTNGEFTRHQFETIRTQLIARQLVRWRDERDYRQGCELTNAGRAVFRKILSETTTPTLYVQDKKQ